MASDVKWIKMMVGMFDGMSFKKIKRAKIGGESFRDKLTAVWFELLDFAGKCNQDGFLIETSEIPFTSLEDIAMMIDRDTQELELCMAYFVKNGMIKITDDVYSIANWSKYQNVIGLDDIREKNRLRVEKHRKNKRLQAQNQSSADSETDCNVTCNVTEMVSNAPRYREETDNKDKELEIDSNSVVNSDNGIDASVPEADKKKQKAVKHSYGEYGNVKLTDDEYQKLMEQYGNATRCKVIAYLDEYIEDKGYKSKSHYLAIKRWVVDAAAKNSCASTGNGTRVLDEAEMAAIRRTMGSMHDFP